MRTGVFRVLFKLRNFCQRDLDNSCFLFFNFDLLNVTQLIFLFFLSNFLIFSCTYSTLFHLSLSLFYLFLFLIFYFVCVSFVQSFFPSFVVFLLLRHCTEQFKTNFSICLIFTFSVTDVMNSFCLN